MASEDLDFKTVVADFRQMRPAADTVVVCDDMTELRRMYARAIRRGGGDSVARVLDYPNAESAIEDLRRDEVRERVLLVVSDRNMLTPLKGEQFAVKLRGELGDRVSPFSLISSDADSEAVRGVFRAGHIDSVLQKPFETAALLPAITLAINHRLLKIIIDQGSA